MEKVEVQIDYSVDFSDGYSADKNIKQVLINGVRVPRVNSAEIHISADTDEPPYVMLKILPDVINSKIDRPRSIQPNDIRNSNKV